MSVQLLDKTRKINKLLHNNNSSKVVFNDICDVLTGILASNVLVISKKGKVLGSGQCEGVQLITELISGEVGSHIDSLLNERLLNILSTKENVNLETLGFESEHVNGYEAIITPINIAGERLGTLFIYKYQATYSIDDIIYNRDDLDFVEAENDEDLAQELIEQMGGLEVLSVETLQRYFNFGAYGRDLAIGDYSKTSHGYIRDI